MNREDKTRLNSLLHDAKFSLGESMRRIKQVEKILCEMRRDRQVESTFCRSETSEVKKNINNAIFDVGILRYALGLTAQGETNAYTD